MTKNVEASHTPSCLAIRSEEDNTWLSPPLTFLSDTFRPRAHPRKKWTLTPHSEVVPERVICHRTDLSHGRHLPSHILNQENRWRLDFNGRESETLFEAGMQITERSNRKVKLPLMERPPYPIRNWQPSYRNRVLPKSYRVPMQIATAAVINRTRTPCSAMEGKRETCFVSPLHHGHLTITTYFCPKSCSHSHSSHISNIVIRKQLSKYHRAQTQRFSMESTTYLGKIM